MMLPGGQHAGMAMLYGFTAGMVASGGDWRAGFVGAWSAGMFFGVGEAFGGGLSWSATRGRILGKVVAHGAVGGAASRAQGGKFGHGFLAAGTAQAFAPGIDRIAEGERFSPMRIAAAATVGGTASVLGGGKFANGAITAAFSRAFNDEQEHRWAKNGPGKVYVNDEGYSVYNVDDWRPIGLAELALEDWQRIAELPLGGRARLPGGRAEISLGVDIQYVRRRYGQFEVSQRYRVQKYLHTQLPTGMESRYMQPTQQEWLGNVSSVRRGIRPCSIDVCGSPAFTW